MWKLSGIIVFLFLCNVLQVCGQTITTFAGCGSCSSLGDGGPATSASIGYFAGLAIDKFDNIYIADGNNHRVRKVSALTNVITTIAGTGVAGYNGDGILATAAELNWPIWIAIDTNNNLFISDGGNYRVRKVNLFTGLISTCAGNGIAGYSGDGTTATNAEINGIQGIFTDLQGNLYINDGNNHRIRKVSTSGIIATIAGTGYISNTGDGGLALSANLSGLLGGCTDVFGNIYTSVNSASVRKIDKTSGIISRVAGTGDSIYSPFLGNGIPATSAHISPFGVACDNSNNLYVADYENHRIQMVTASGFIYTIAGNGTSGYSGDNGPATAAQISYPENIIVDKCANVYVADFNNRRVRKITYNPPPCDYLSIDEQLVSKAISIYPNPANDELHIENAQANTSYQLCNLVGSVVQYGSLKQGNNTIFIKHLPPGMYLLLLTDEEGKRTVHKVVKE